MTAQQVLDYLVQIQKEGADLDTLSLTVECQDSLGKWGEKPIASISLHRCTSSVVMEIEE